MTMNQREIQTLLSSIPGVRKAYFQPPPNTRMSYPCIVYSLDHMELTHADDGLYRVQKRYSVTVIDKDPLTTIPDEVAKLPECYFERFFTKDNLNHYIFRIYF